MTELLLIRHGETAWNRERRMQGHIDIPLSDAGVRQAQALGQALATERPDAIYASDLGRARATAQPVADVHHLPLILRAALRERCYGAFEGLLYDEISQRYPEAFAAWRARELHARFPAGEREAETQQEFHDRAVKAVADIVSAHPVGKIVVVTHGGVLDCLYREATGMRIDAERDFGIVNAAINRLQWDGRHFRVLQWSDASHLEAAGLDEIDRSHPAA